MSSEPVKSLHGKCFRKKKPVTMESNPKYAAFEQSLLKHLTCLRALNYNQVAYLGKELDHLDDNRAYRILWCEEDGTGDANYRRLQKLAARGFVTPWKMWPPDRLLTSLGKNRAPVKRKGVFYILGKEGRRYMVQTKNAKLFPLNIEELYMTNIPLARWVTASSVAMTMEQSGYVLRPLKEVWEDREDVKKPLFKPDFIAEMDNRLFSFAVYESPFGLQSQNFTSSVGRILNYLKSSSYAVILIRTKEAFKEILTAMKGDCLPENQERVFVGDLTTFKQKQGHTVVVNALGKEITL